MPSLWIREFQAFPAVDRYRPGLHSEASEMASIALEPGVDMVPVAITATSAQSEVFEPDTRYVVITSDVAFHYVAGVNPTATRNHLRIPAGTIWPIGVQSGQRLAVISAV